VSTPAGWYPTPNGGQRYWDGHRWLALPEPDDAKSDDAGPYDYATASLMQSAHEKSTAYNRKTIVIAALAAGVLAAAVAGGLFWKNQHDTQMRNNAAAAASSSAVAAAEQQAATARAARAAAVKDIEASVMTMANKHVADGIIDGPVLSASCVPVDGGSTDDLTEKTTVFECFVAEKDNGDGTMSGMKYHATQNWTTGEYTYGLGAPR
jgi:hypothetical protein